MSESSDRKVLFSGSRVTIFDDYPVKSYELKPLVSSARDEELSSFLSEALSRRVKPGEFKFSSLTDAESKALVSASSLLLERLPLGLFERFLDPSQLKGVQRVLIDFLKSSASFADSVEGVSLEVMERVAGYGRLTPLMSDDSLEEVVLNSGTQPLFVYHRKFGLCKTNVFFDSVEDVYSLIRRVEFYSKRQATHEFPLLEASFPDGSRINVTIPPATPRSPTLTVRKFTHEAFTLNDLIKSKTISSEALAFLWVATEGFQLYPLNVLICGGTGAGKTTLLNALSLFAPKNERVVSVEDTLELKMWGRENWVQMQSHPVSSGASELTMDELLKNSLRMRPDRIFVGEVRGKEAQTLFTALNVGHRGFLGTLHANSAQDAVLRLNNPPMSVPKELIPLIDLVVVMQRVPVRGKGSIRRVVEVSEVSRMNDEPSLNALFTWNQLNDSLNRTDVPARTIEVLARFTGRSKLEVAKELKIRAKIIDWVVENEIDDVEGIDTVIHAYYAHPELVLKKLGAGSEFSA